jgi:hypothetical protein
VYSSQALRSRQNGPMSVFFEVKIFKRIRRHVWIDHTMQTISQVLRLPPICVPNVGGIEDACWTPYPMWFCVPETQEMPAIQFHGKYIHKVPDTTAATTASTKSWKAFYIPQSEIQKPCKFTHDQAMSYQIQKPCIILVTRNPNPNTIIHAFFSSVCRD